MTTEREEQIRHLNEVLQPWRGAQAQFWSYTAALATLEIRLFSDRRPGNLHVVCSPCVSIAGPVYWESCELAVGEEPSEGGLFVVQDQRAGVRVLCRQGVTFKNVEPLFPPLGGGAEEKLTGSVR
jgi:hypothetical protein